MIKIRGVNAQQYNNKIIDIPKRLLPQLQDKHHMQMIAQPSSLMPSCAGLSRYLSAPPLANMRFTIINNIQISDITFDSRLCKQLMLFKQLN